MKKFIISSIITALVLSGCSDRKDLEKTTIALTIAIDVAEDNKIIAYESNPIFGEEIAEDTETISAVATTLREAREKMNAETNGPVVGGKLQVLLVGKDLLAERELYPVLDILYRDAKNATNARLVAFEGSISEIMNMKVPEKPILSMYLTNLIKHASERGFTPNTTLQDYHYQHYEKGITPFITEVKKAENKMVVTGTALLNNKGHYVTSLDRRQSSLLQIVQKEVEYPVHIILQIPEHVQLKNNGSRQVSFNITTAKHKVKTRHKNGNFKFDIQSEMNIAITEMPFNVNMDKDKKLIERLIADELNKEYKHLISTIQENAIDPIGLGLFARAYHYEEWKRVQDRWGTALSNADVNIKSNVNIVSYGILK